MEGTRTSAPIPTVPPTPSIIVTGPTASGKSLFAERLARELCVPLISLDSMQIYRGMDIGTAKPDAATIRELPVRLVNLRDPWEPFSIGDFLREFRALVAELPSPWLFCGGTPFYVNALIAGIHPGPPPCPELRERLQREAHELGSARLHALLAERDPPAAAQLHPNDLRRIVRALEVLESTGERMSELQKRKAAVLPEGAFRLVGFRHAREELYRRIDRRVVEQFRAGWVAEVERLCAAHQPPWGTEASQSIGYERIRSALASGEDPESGSAEIQQRTRNFARNQLTWFRRMPIEWWGAEEAEALIASLRSDLATFSERARIAPPDPARALPEGA